MNSSLLRSVRPGLFSRASLARNVHKLLRSHHCDVSFPLVSCRLQERLGNSRLGVIVVNRRPPGNSTNHCLAGRSEPDDCPNGAIPLRAGLCIYLHCDDRAAALEHGSASVATVLYSAPHSEHEGTIGVSRSPALPTYCFCSYNGVDSHQIRMVDCEHQVLYL